jgi:type IV pilus assembly protein PilA
VRTKVTEGLSLAASAKTAVSDNASSGNEFASGWTAPGPTDSVAKDLTDPGIEIDATTGDITIHYTPKIAAVGSNTLVLSPRDGASSDGTDLVKGTPPTKGSITWECNSADKPTNSTGRIGTILGKYVPANCRA